jgi:hypothetical protein
MALHPINNSSGKFFERNPILIKMLKLNSKILRHVFFLN